MQEFRKQMSDLWLKSAYNAAKEMERAGRERIQALIEGFRYMDTPVKPIAYTDEHNDVVGVVMVDTRQGGDQVVLTESGEPVFISDGMGCLVTRDDVARLQSHKLL